MPNIELMLRTLEKIQEEAKKPLGESLWWQGSWDRVTECGTAHCFGGWACALSGLRSEGGMIVTEGPYHGMWTGDAARILLGLSTGGAMSLFGANNSLVYIGMLVRRYAEEVDEVAKQEEVE